MPLASWWTAQLLPSRGGMSVAMGFRDITTSIAVSPSYNRKVGLSSMSPALLQPGLLNFAGHSLGEFGHNLDVLGHHEAL